MDKLSHVRWIGIGNVQKVWDIGEKEGGRGRRTGERKSIAWPEECFRVYTITSFCFRQFVQREFITATTPVFKDI